MARITVVNDRISSRFQCSYIPGSNNLDKSAKTEDWRSLMTKIAEFCPYLDDPDGCKKELLKLILLPIKSRLLQIVPFFCIPSYT